MGILYVTELFKYDLFLIQMNPNQKDRGDIKI